MIQIIYTNCDGFLTKGTVRRGICAKHVMPASRQEFVDLFYSMHVARTLLRLKVHHVLFWIVVAMVWYYLRYQDYATSQQAWIVTLIKTADLALMIYLCNYLLIPKLFYRKKYFLFFTTFLLMIVCSSIIKMSVIGQITGTDVWGSTVGLKERIYNNFIPHFFLVTAGVAAKLLIDYIKLQKTMMEVAKEKAETELNFLKSQINPHFLFNSLNAVYFLIDKQNTGARMALHKFSEMLRYQLYEAGDDLVTIEKEIGYLRDYVSLQQLRRENCSITMDVEKGMQSFSIAPLLLLPFVENAFKHLSHFGNERKDEVLIRLSRANGAFHFFIANTTAEKPESAQGGIGLTNVKRRLELLYPGKHKLDVRKKENWFEAELTLHLNN